MEKKKRDFNLKAYDYMDSSMRREGWIWEFIRRNSSYRTDYRRTINKLKMLNEEDIFMADKIHTYFVNKYSLYLQFVSNTIGIRGQQLLKDTPVTKYKRLWGTLGIWFPPDPDMTWLEILPDYEKHFFSFFPGSPVYTYSSDELRSICITGEPSDGFYDYVVNELLVHRDKKTTLYMSIDLSAPFNLDQLTDIIRKKIAGKKKELGIQETKSPKKLKSRQKKDDDANGDEEWRDIMGKNVPIWKSYLVIYDLHKQGLSYDQIRILLCIKHADKRYYSEKTIANHFNAAKDLIYGGYKKYL